MTPRKGVVYKDGTPAVDAFDLRISNLRPERVSQAVRALLSGRPVDLDPSLDIATAPGDAGTVWFYVSALGAERKAEFAVRRRIDGELPSVDWDEGDPLPMPAFGR